MMDRVYNYIGLMYKANKIKIGFKAFKNLSKGGRVFLVVYTSDASNKIKNILNVGVYIIMSRALNLALSIF